MRSFRGDLRHDPQAPGCSFVLDLVPAVDDSGEQTPSIANDASHTTLTS